MTDRQLILMQQALDALLALRYRSLKDEPDGVITALRDRLAHCDRCGKKMGGEGDIHTCTPKADPIGDAQDRLIAEMAAQPEQEPVKHLMVAYKLAQKELAHLIEENFGQMPRNDKWADSVLDLRNELESQQIKSDK